MDTAGCLDCDGYDRSLQAWSPNYVIYSCILLLSPTYSVGAILAHLLRPHLKQAQDSFLGSFLF